MPIIDHLPQDLYDFSVSGSMDTLITVYPETQAAVEWMQNNAATPEPDDFPIGDGIPMEPQYAYELIQGAKRDGLTCNPD